MKVEIQHNQKIEVNTRSMTTSLDPVSNPTATLPLPPAVTLALAYLVQNKSRWYFSTKMNKFFEKNITVTLFKQIIDGITVIFRKINGDTVIVNLGARD